MEIPDYAIERIACCLLPMIQAYYESDEGQAELAAWNEKKDAVNLLKSQVLIKKKSYRQEKSMAKQRRQSGSPGRLK